MTSLESAGSGPDAAGASPEETTSAGDRTARNLWGIVLIATFAGLGFTTVQIVEKITILKDPFTSLACDVNATLSCSSVLNAWQSSVLGPPNSLIGAIMFAILASAAFAGMLGSSFSNAYVATCWGLAVFFLAFASWFMYETAFSIGALCLWCVGITTAVVVICAALTRIADRAAAFGDGRFGRGVSTAVRSRLDLAVWAGWWLVVAALLWIGLAG
jgi:uncharacterized membrane protein